MFNQIKKRLDVFKELEARNEALKQELEALKKELDLQQQHIKDLAQQTKAYNLKTCLSAAIQPNPMCAATMLRAPATAPAVVVATPVDDFVDAPVVQVPGEATEKHTHLSLAVLAPQNSRGFVRQACFVAFVACVTLIFMTFSDLNSSDSPRKMLDPSSLGLCDDVQWCGWFSELPTDFYSVMRKLMDKVQSIDWVKSVIACLRSNQFAVGCLLLCPENPQPVG